MTKFSFGLEDKHTLTDEQIDADDPSLDHLEDYRWDIFITHDPRNFAARCPTFELFNKIDPANFPDKLQYGVKVLVDNHYEISEPSADQLSATSVFQPADAPDSLDNLSIWSGCGITHQDDLLLYYTGVSAQELACTEAPEEPKSLGMIPQRMFGAISNDRGRSWQRLPNNPLVDLANQSNNWYERDSRDNVTNGQVCVNSACRDPFVFQATEQYNIFDDDSQTIAAGRFYMLFTARVNADQAPMHQQDIHYRGCIGVAYSDSPLGPFHLQEPILNLGLFGDMELPHLITKGGEIYLIFCVQDKCIDGQTSTDSKFAAQIGIDANQRHSYGFRYNPTTQNWQPMNDRGGLIESPAGLYGIRIFNDPKQAGQFGARGFVLPNQAPQESPLQEFTLSPLLKVDWPEDARVKITL